MQTHPDAIGAGGIVNSDARRLEFVYDYLGRRVQKIVRDGFNGSAYTTVKSNRKYLYDGWNLIAEFDATGTLTLVKSYTWGLDIAGSLTATGGVGALLQIRDHALSRTWLPTYDGNGNVVSLLDGEAGSATIAAAYEYGPFGEALRAEVLDADAATVSFRFSTKFTDAETGLVYYGLRYYSPTLGRFINRDPVGEEGGLNLYGFVSNDGVNRQDFLGMDECGGPGQPPCPLETFRVSGSEDDGTFAPGIRIPPTFGGGFLQTIQNMLALTSRPKPVFKLTQNAPNTPSPDCLEARAALADAQNARAAYGGDPAPGWKPADAAALGLDPSMFANNQSGFGAVLLQNTATGALQVSYRGTDPALNDWGNNIAQSLGFTGSQYQQAINVATTVNLAADQRGLDLTFTGHSLGGGMAAAGAMAVGGSNLNPTIARTFNAAGVNYLTASTFNLSLKVSDRIDAYYVRGDPLHVFQTIPIAPSADGTRMPLNGTGRFGSIERHSMNTVIKSLENEVAQKCK